MHRQGTHSVRLSNLVLAIILIAAQALASAHAFEHEPGNPQNQVCTTCVAASQLGAATVDSGAISTVTHTAIVQLIPTHSSYDSIHVVAARQRGPPTSF